MKKYFITLIVGIILLSSSIVFMYLVCEDYITGDSAIFTEFLCYLFGTIGLVLSIGGFISLMEENNEKDQKKVEN